MGKFFYIQMILNRNDQFLLGGVYYAILLHLRQGVACDTNRFSVWIDGFKTGWLMEMNTLITVNLIIVG